MLTFVHWLGTLLFFTMVFQSQTPDNQSYETIEQQPSLRYIQDTMHGVWGREKHAVIQNIEKAVSFKEHKSPYLMLGCIKIPSKLNMKNSV